MYPNLSVIIITVFICVPICLCVDDDQYVACGELFNCSNIGNIGYPFWGENRQGDCGHPAFELSNCEGDFPLITIQSIPYRVLAIDNTTQSLTVARDDLANSTCPRYLHNTTLDFNLLNYASNQQNVTMHYGCTLIAGQLLPLSTPYPCTINGTTSLSYFVMENILTPVVRLGLATICSNYVITPVNQAWSEALTRATASITELSQALASGFELQWSAIETRCAVCQLSGGRCGSNSTSFACYCTDQPYTLSCRGGRSSSGIVSIAVPVVGAVLGGVIIGWLIFFCRQRRKRLAAKSSQTQSSELLTAPSSKGLTSTYSAKFTERIPSYPSSNSDIGKGSTYFGVQVFSYNELEEATNNFDASRELGDGGFGTVYYGKLLDGREIAVKRLYENNFRRVEQFMNEVEILTRLNHQYLVKLYGCTSKRSRELLLVYEYIPNGTVADHLHGKQAKSGSLPWPIRLKIAIETAEALAYLHRSDIIHRDVKTTNILLDNSFCVKVADFGLSRLFPNDATHVSTAPQGTPGYVDPEYYQCYQLTDKSDVFSFGVVLIELISSLQAVDTNRHRHDINLANMAVNKIQNHGLNELIDPSLGCKMDSSVRRMTTMVAELAFRCLQQEKDMRPTMKEVLDILRVIENEESHVQKAEVVEIVVDEGDVVPLKDNPPPPGPFSPDSVIVNEWVSSSTLDSEN